MEHLHLAYCQGDLLLTADGSIPSGERAPLPMQPWEHVTDIVSGERCCHIYRLTHPVTGRDDLRMMPLRKTYQLLSPEDYSLAGKGAELVYFDSTTRHCGVCGSPNRWQTPISKQCTGCGKEWWPSLAVAIIVRITRGDEILLVHAKSFRGNFHGLVAGFVETGETLEECVRREVMEETGITVRNIRYFASQPWPFPSGLMVGFTADYESGQIRLQREELSGGGWFRRDCLPEIPDKASIARRLIDDWLQS